MRLGRAALAASTGYLIGTFPTADLVARRVSGGRVDLRTAGSGNPGGANAAKVLGKSAGYTIMGVDIAKGAAACVVGGMVAGPIGTHIAGTASVVGHCLPVWNGFRGGKGVAASIGQCLATFPAYFPADVVVAAVAMTIPRWKQRVFASTVASSVCWVLGAVVWWRRQLPNLWGPRPSAALPIAAAASSAMIVYKFVTAKPPFAGSTPTAADAGLAA